MVVTKTSNTPNKAIIRLSCMERGPGPGKYCLPGTCGRGDHDPTKYSKPAYSFGTKLKSPKEYKSPGPVYFVPPNITRRGPDGTASYSMTARRQGPSQLNTPGPSECMYSMIRIHYMLAASTP